MGVRFLCLDYTTDVTGWVSLPHDNFQENSTWLDVWRFTPVTPTRTFVVNVEVLHGRPVGLFAPLVQSRWSRLFQRAVSGLARRAEGEAERAAPVP